MSGDHPLQIPKYTIGGKFKYVRESCLKALQPNKFIFLLLLALLTYSCARPKMAPEATSELKTDPKPTNPDDTPTPSPDDDTPTPSPDDDTPTPSPDDGNTTTCNLQFSQSKHCLRWQWIKLPESGGYGQISVEIFSPYREGESPIYADPAGDLDLVLWMPSMGHGSVKTKSVRLNIGRFEVNQIFFVMPGEWELRFQIKEQGKVIDEVRVLITI